MSLTPYVHLARGSLEGATAGAAVELPEDARNHLHRVLRKQVGALVVVADGEGREMAAVLGVGMVVLEGTLLVHDAPSPGLHLVQALPKGKKVDEVVRSATEMGVDRITIVSAQRSELRPAKDKFGKLLTRWEAIARSAAEQARRPFLPEVAGPVDLDVFLAGVAPDAAGVVGHPATDQGLRDALGHIALDELGEMIALVGPEGGWTDPEMVAFEAAGLRAVTLGASVLRTEHAGYALCAVLAFHLGRMG